LNHGSGLSRSSTRKEDLIIIPSINFSSGYAINVFNKTLGIFVTNDIIYIKG